MNWNIDCEDIEDSESEPKPERKHERRLVDSIVEVICGCVEDGDTDVHLQVIKALVTVVSAFQC